MIVFVAGMSVIIAYFIADAVIGKPDKKDAKVQTISSIAGSVTDPDKTIFNSDAINPTVKVTIGNE